MKEAYIRYDVEKDTVYYCDADGSISLNSSDFFFVWKNEEWVWTKLCWSENKGWFLDAAPELNLQTGKKIKAAVDVIDPRIAESLCDAIDYYLTAALPDKKE